MAVLQVRGGVPTGAGLGGEMVTIHVPADFSFFPLHRIGMETVRRIQAAGNLVGLTGVFVARPGPAIVQGAVHPILAGDLQVDRLQNVDLPGQGPATVNPIRRQHPERRPAALPLRQFCPHFEAPVFPVTEPLGAQARRRVGATARGIGGLIIGVVVDPVWPGDIFADGFDVQQVVGYPGVFRVVDVTLGLIVAAAGTIFFVRPFFAIDGRTGKFVGPYQAVARIQRVFEALLGPLVRRRIHRHVHQSVVVFSSAASPTAGGGGNRQSQYGGAGQKSGHRCLLIT